MKTPRELPKVELGGKTYYVDSRLQELRNVENPFDSVDFSNISPAEQFVLMQAMNGNVSSVKEFDDGTALVGMKSRRKS